MPKELLIPSPNPGRYRVALCPNPGPSGGLRAPLVGEPLCCAPSGRCCLDNGNCEVLTSDECVRRRGVYFGDGTSCSGAVCTGACCAPGGAGTCTVTGFGPCFNQISGDWKGFGTTCSPNPCPQPSPCCAQGGKCISSTIPFTTMNWSLTASGYTSHCCAANAPNTSVVTPFSANGGGTLSVFVQPGGANTECGWIGLTGPLWVTGTPQPNCPQSFSDQQRIGLNFSTSAAQPTFISLYTSLDLAENSGRVTTCSTAIFDAGSCSVFQRSCRDTGQSTVCPNQLLYDISSVLTVTLPNRSPCPGSGIPSVFLPPGGDGTAWSFESGPGGLIVPSRRVLVPGVDFGRGSVKPGGCGGCGGDGEVF